MPIEREAKLFQDGPYIYAPASYTYLLVCIHPLLHLISFCFEVIVFMLVYMLVIVLNDLHALFCLIFSQTLMSPSLN